MSNDAKGNETTGTQALPFEVPPQDTARYSVRQIPGLRLWVVWDNQRDEAQGHWSVGTPAESQSVADRLNER